ncbi:MAG: type II toxin-antitoxin system RelE/ParE family toxin [Acidobacteriaceae bacterium]
MTRHLELIVAPTARRDMQDIYDYLADDNPDAADQVIEQLRQAFRHLGEFPGSGHSRVDLAGGRGLLFWSVGRYLVLYRVTASSVEIAAVLHGSRDIPAVLREREPDE